jgi:hypothetical protein
MGTVLTPGERSELQRLGWDLHNTTADRPDELDPDCVLRIQEDDAESAAYPILDLHDHR